MMWHDLFLRLQFFLLANTLALPICFSRANYPFILPEKHMIQLTHQLKRKSQERKCNGVPHFLKKQTCTNIHCCFLVISYFSFKQRRRIRIIKVFLWRYMHYGIWRIKTHCRRLSLTPVWGIKKKRLFPLGKFMQWITLRLVCRFTQFIFSSTLT